MLDVGAEDAVEVAAAEDQQPVEALGSDCANEALAHASFPRGGP